MKWLPRPRFILVSPWLLAAATGLLVLIIVTFALSNIRREKTLMLNALLQKAVTLQRVIRSGARASYLAELRRGTWQPEPWLEHVQRVIDHLSDDPELYFLALVNDKGLILAHSRSVMKGRTLDLDLPRALVTRQQGDLMYRIDEEEDGRRFFTAITRILPFTTLFPRVPLSLQELHRRFSSQLETDRERSDQARYFLIVALDMKGYDRALARLRFQVLMLSLAMLLVGVGGWLSLAAVQGYRVSQNTLREIKAFTGLLISKLPVGIIATDTRGRIATWNQAVADLTGISTSRAAGRRPGDLLPPELASFFGTETERCPGKREGIACEICLVIGGRELVLRCHHLVIVNDSGESEGEVLLLTDVTELKTLEKEMRKSERLAAVGRMAAGVAHEVRNPLSSVKGLALLLQTKFNQGTRERETATLLIREVERMNRTISELLSFARPAPLELQEVDLAELLEQQVTLLAADTDSGAITFHLEVDDRLPRVAADRDRLSQVLMNVLLNAVQAMADGGEVRVSARSGEDGEQVVITISDTGEGMDQETLGQIFFPYFTTKTRGTGIGLAISQKVIADHGGNIQVDSEKGRGTVVTIELPVRKPAPDTSG